MDALHTGATACRQNSSAGLLLELDPATCANSVGHCAMPLRHHLNDHPLLTLQAIASLADSLPVQEIECLPAVQALDAAGAKLLSLARPSETVLTIGTNNCWMVMKNIEYNPEYRRLLNETLDLVAPLLPEREGGMRLRETFLFLSAPNAVTPAHIDPEHNLLLQVRGAKQFSVGKFSDHMTEYHEIKRYLDGGHRNIRQVPPAAGVFDLQPGDGLYLPPWRPHWVKNGPDVSISLSVTFRTRRSERYEYAHMFNNKLQRFGLSPRPAGEAQWLDALKASYVRGKRWMWAGGRRQPGVRKYS